MFFKENKLLCKETVKLCCFHSIAISSENLGKSESSSYLFRSRNKTFGLRGSSLVTDRTYFVDAQLSYGVLYESVDQSCSFNGVKVYF